MTVAQFNQAMADAEKNFKTACKDFPEHAEFLSKCKLILSYDSRQFNFKEKLSVEDISERMVLVKESDFKDNLLCLNKHLKDAQAAAKKAQGQEGTRIKEKVRKIEVELNSFPLDELEFHDDFDVQVIFPIVNSDIIQMLKGHYLVNKTKSCMCKACIRVFFY